MFKNHVTERSLRRLSSTFGAVFILFVASLACNLPTAGVEEQPELQPEGFVETSIAQTVAASGQQDGGEAPADQPDPLAPTNTPDPTATPGASETPEPTATISPTPSATFTPTSDAPLLYISENTNCRTGPGAVYDWLTVLLSGDESALVAKDPTEKYWYIQNPDKPGDYCWLWGRYATPEGDTETLPVYTPPPTPTQSLDFKITYQDLFGPCSDWYLMYRIDNVGAFKLESWRTSATDYTGGSNPKTIEKNVFQEYNASCTSVSDQDDLTPGEGHFVVMKFKNDPSGHDIATQIKICTKENLAGECETKIYRHKP